MNGFYDFLSKRALFILFAFCVNVLIFSFSQQEYNLGDASTAGTVKSPNMENEKQKEEMGLEDIKDDVAKRKDQYQKAIEEYSQAITLKPSDYVPYYNRGLAYYHIEDYVSALTDLQKADSLSGGSDVEVKNNIGVVFSKQGKYDEALKIYEEAIRVNPGNYKPYNNMGIVLNILGRPEEALKVLEKGISLNPAEAKLYNNKGVSLSQMHKYVQAIEEYNRSLKLDPYNHKAYNNRGIAIAKMESFLKEK